MRLVKIFLALIAAMALLFATGTYGYYKGWHIDKFAPVDLAARLAPDLEIFTPPGAGPFPAVIGFHGCSGLLDGVRDWAEYLRQNGYVVVLVDSISLRKLEWRAVCAGETLWGSERAGDVVAALQHVRQMEMVDNQRLILMGWSHGGWTLIDFFALLAQGQTPTNLTHVPDNAMAGIIGAVLFYPFCAFPSVGRNGWDLDAPVHFIFAENDSIVPNRACLKVIDKMRAQNKSVSFYTYAGLDHAFDMRTSDFFEGTLKNAPDATLDVRQRVRDYLQTLN